MNILTNVEIKKMYEKWAKGEYTEKERSFMEMFPRDPEIAQRAVSFRAGLIIGRAESVNDKL